MACPLRHDCDYALAEGRHLEPGLVRPKNATPKKARKHTSGSRAAMLALPAAATDSMKGTSHETYCSNARMASSQDTISARCNVMDL